MADRETGEMGRRTLALGLMWVLVLAGCGGSGQATSTTTPKPAATSAPPGGSTSASTGGSTSPPPGGATPAPTGGSTTTSPGATTTGARATGTHTSTAGPANVAPATFVIRPGGALSPPTVSVIASIPIELTVSSGDGKAHVVVLHAPFRRTLSVPAGRSASVLATGLRSGRYRIDVDGVARGTLVIGFTPGP